MFLPVMLSEGRTSKVGGKVQWWLGIMFLTNVFFIPFLALRAAPEQPQAQPPLQSKGGDAATMNDVAESSSSSSSSQGDEEETSPVSTRSMRPKAAAAASAAGGAFAASGMSGMQMPAPVPQPPADVPLPAWSVWVAGSSLAVGLLSIGWALAAR